MKNWVLIIAFFMTFGCSNGFAQQSPLSSDSGKSWVNYQLELSRLWKIQNEFMEHSDEFQGDQLFNQIKFLKGTYDVKEIPTLSKSFLKRIPSNKSLAEKERHPLYQKAEEISPDHYSSDYFLCDFSSSPTEWTTAIKHCFHGLEKEMARPGELLNFLSKFSYQVFLTFVFLILLYFALITHKFLPFSMQYYSSNFYWISPFAFFFLIATIGLLIFMTFGWIFVFALIYIFLWRFLSIPEKGLFLAVLGIVMAIPFTFIAPSLNVRYHTGVFADLFDAESSLQPQIFVDRIKSYVNLHPKESYALFELGTLETKSGNYYDAQTYFEKSQEIQPLFIKTKLNLANLHYEQGQSDLAKEEYTKLIAQNPNMISAYFNLSQIYTHESRYLEGEEYMNKAKKMDPLRFKDLSKLLHDRGGSVKLFYEELSLDDVSKNIYQTAGSFQDYFRQFFANYFPQYSPKLFYMTLIFSVLAAFALRLLGNTPSFFVLYASREKNIEQMTFIQLKEFPKAYKKFASSVERREKIRSIIGYLVPGVWHFWAEKTMLSFLMALLFFFFFSGVIAEVSSFRDDYRFPWLFLQIVFMVLMFLLNFVLIRIDDVKKKS